MELQLFDDQAVPLFRILRGEPLWTDFRRALSAARVLQSDETELERDLRLDHPRASAVLTSLEGPLRAGLATAVADGRGETRPRRMETSTVTVVVLGTTLSLNLASPPDAALFRLNEMTTAMRGALDSGQSIDVLVVPDMSRVTNAVAWLLRTETRPMPKDELRERLLRGFDDADGRADDPASRRENAADAALVRERGLDEVLASLAAWRMVDESPSGEIAPTEKLRMIRA